MVDSRRRLAFLVPDPERRRILAASGALPTRFVTLAEDRPTISAAVAEAAALVGRPLPVVEIHFDYALDFEAGPIPVLVVTETLDGDAPDGLVWRDVAADPPAVDTGLADRMGTWLAEWRSGAEPPALRPRWARHGWHARATRWIDDRLAALGRSPTGPPEQVRHWGISAMLRAPTDGGAAWFKAVFPPFHHEPAATELLAAAAPDVLPRVLAADHDEGWLLTDDLGSDEMPSPGDHDDAAARLVALQLAMVSRTGELLEVGCPSRPIGSLVASLRAILDETPRLPGIPGDLERDRLLDRVAGAAAAIASLGVPDTLVHGDFHRNNVLVGLGGRPVLIDWSDAAVGCPLVDVVTWPGGWLEPEVREAGRAAILRAWQAAMGRDLSPFVEDLVTAGAAYQAVSYAGIVRGLEPARRPEMADGLDHFLRMAAGAGGREP